MSLFQNKEWWGLKVGENEEFDSNHLCVSPLNPTNPNENHLILASYQGKLRIYAPKFREYKIEDLLFEKDFQMPIIQVAIGKFIPTSSENALCVLFFKKFSVFSLNFSNNGISCKLLYENNLPRNAYNMVVGGFGGGKQRDFICIQSCDGFLMIYEQDKFASLSQLNEYILPSPIFYVEVTDSFILQNSSYELESYRYSSIGANFNSQKENKVLLPDWSINLGEAARKISGFWRNEKSFEIFILCEMMLFVVSHTGGLLTHKKLEYPPCDIFMYDNPLSSAKSKNNLIYEQGQNQENAMNNPATFVISSFTHHILVYKDFQLMWASKMNTVAHGVEVSSFEGQGGLITTINEEGWLEVSYLGTDPPMIAGGLVDSKEIDYEKMDREFSGYLEKIQALESGKGPKKQEVTEKLSCNITVFDPVVSQDYLENSNSLFSNENGDILMVKVRIGLSYSGEKANNINIILNLPNNIYTPENPIYIENIKGVSTPYNHELNLYCLNSEFPYKNSFEVQISYYNALVGKSEFKESRCLVREVIIPSGLQYRCVPPVKNANFKLTIGLNQEVQEVINKSEKNAEILANPNALSFLLANGVDTTVLVGKTANKIRIQSSFFEGLYFILIEIQRILSKGNPKINVLVFQDSLPLQDFFVVIDQHFALREILKNFKIQLEQKTEQFRIIQKRMLTRYKDKNSTPLNNLDVLFTRNYEEIIELANQIEESQKALTECHHRLVVNLDLILLLVKLRFELPEESFTIISEALTSEFGQNDSEMNWEDVTYANIGYLIKNFSKKDKDGGVLVSLHAVDDIEKFKKHLTLLIDKISKGGLENMELFDKAATGNQTNFVQNSGTQNIKKIIKKNP